MSRTRWGSAYSQFPTITHSTSENNNAPALRSSSFSVIVYASNHIKSDAGIYYDSQFSIYEYISLHFSLLRHVGNTSKVNGGAHEHYGQAQILDVCQHHTMHKFNSTLVAFVYRRLCSVNGGPLYALCNEALRVRTHARGNVHCVFTSTE